MKTRWLLTSLVTFSLMATLPGWAQDPAPPGPPSSTGWRRFQQPAPPPDGPAAPDPAQDSAQPFAAAQPPSGPAGLTIPAGTWITIRVNEPLSSDHNQPGDAFVATLAQPLVVNGLLLARRGQTVTGMVTEAKKAGRASGLSRLGLELTEVGLADGNQVQIKTQMMERHGDTSFGRDAVGIGATIGTGAAIGAAVNGGVGAGVGAAAGVVASTIGVLLTRGKPTVVYPETPLTFRLEAPVTIDTASQAFQPPSQRDYEQSTLRRPAPRPGYGPGYGPPPPPYFYPPYYRPYPYPYFYGPSFFFGYRGFHRW
ncbi:MAG TPA: hypothetical protein VEV17_07030 [Bryobacteraceae bacterium]|nr:hypothetical protein [Bryobacteraceae bacterium]